MRPYLTKGCYNEKNRSCIIFMRYCGTNSKKMGVQ